MAIALTATGLWLQIFPEAMAYSQIPFIFGARSLMAVSLIVGTARISFLTLNGRFPMAGPIVRAAGALCGTWVWAQMMIALIWVQIVRGEPQPLVPLLAVVAAYELYSTCLACADARYVR